MIASDIQNGVNRLAALIAAANQVVPFTGAGISTECGIPDFRSPGGIWTKNKPIAFEAFVASQAMRDEAWRRRFAMQAHFAGAMPGRGHRAIANLYHSGKVPGVITQNIDNLHQDSGVAPHDVIELHGNTTYATCLDCGQRHELDLIRATFESLGRAPDCSRCDGIIKTATISFGQSMPQDAMKRAEALTLGCDLFIVVGSSLVVWPAASFPLIAKRKGARLVIVNREPTEFDEIADLVLHHSIGEVFSRITAPNS